jgi:hypothetical protein
MTLNPKPQASFKELVSFYLCGSIGLIAVTRNVIRMRRYHKSFQKFTDSLQKYRHNFEEIERIRDTNIKQTVFLETVFPNFAMNYFQNTQHPERYKTSVGKFY